MIHELNTEDDLVAAIGTNNFAWVQEQTITHIMDSISTGKVKPTKGYTGMMFDFANRHRLWIEIDWICTVYQGQAGFDVGFHVILLADTKEDFLGNEILDRYNFLMEHLKETESNIYKQFD